MNKFVPIVNRGIPDEILQSALQYLSQIARHPLCPMPSGGYNLVHSRKNAASIKVGDLASVHVTPPAGSGWDYDLESDIPVPFGHHLVLCPLNEEGKEILWMNDEGVPLRCWANGALLDAALVADRSLITSTNGLLARFRGHIPLRLATVAALAAKQSMSTSS